MIPIDDVCQNFIEKGYNIFPCKPTDHQQLYSLFKATLEKDDMCSAEDVTEEEFRRRFLCERSHVYVLKALENFEIVGALSFKAKRAAKCRHVAKVLYLRAHQHAGKGLSELLVHASIAYAADKNFLSLQTDLVGATHQPSSTLYKNAGFEWVGYLDNGIMTRDGRYANALYFQKDLKGIKHEFKHLSALPMTQRF